MKKLILAFFDKKFLKFCLVGALNTLVGSGLMFILYNVADCSYNFSTVMNYVVGSILSYFLNRYFTFEVKERSIKQVLRFAVNIAVCWFLAYKLAKPLVVLVEPPTASLISSANSSCPAAVGCKPSLER